MADIEELQRRSAIRSSHDTYENWEFLKQVIEAYDELHSRFPYRIVRCETTGRDDRYVRDFVADIVKDYLKTSEPVER
jgi:thymidylate kinase